MEFATLCADTALKFNPRELGLVPADFWRFPTVTFGELVRSFFQKKNSRYIRFPYKLINALKLCEAQPHLSTVVGIEWVTEKVLKVNRHAFARLLAIRVIDGSLFHQQGNFPSHGFVELGITNAKEYVIEEQLKDVDFENVRLFVHRDGTFARGRSAGQDLETLRWIKPGNY
jgi:hypothetical protein